MLNKTDRHKIAGIRLHKTLTRRLHVLLPFYCKWLPILNNIRVRQAVPSRTSTAHREFWRSDGQQN